MATLTAQRRVVKTPAPARESSRGLAGANVAGTSPTRRVWVSSEGARADLGTYVRVQVAKRVRDYGNHDKLHFCVTLTVDLERFAGEDLPMVVFVCERGRRYVCSISGVDPRPETNGIAVTYACKDSGEDRF
ncbi:hypothetical protein [Alienimonas sp. DA493]|uniref:hypothetical protein n=1 Tax=Alienimonas sp. DA493 TaxID=3373605 RepID=UPI0037547211